MNGEPPTDAEILRDVEAAGGWGPYFREAQRRLREQAARVDEAGKNFTHTAIWEGDE